MSRDVTTPPSEGEIIESGSEKANTLTTAQYDISVDRPSRLRQNPALSSESPQYAPSFVYDRDRSRSRSPYREPRGLKRSREGEQRENSASDPRRFRIRYEDNRRASFREENHWPPEPQRQSVDGLRSTIQPSKTRDRYKQRPREERAPFKPSERYNSTNAAAGGPVSVVHKGGASPAAESAQVEHTSTSQTTVSAGKSEPHFSKDHKLRVSGVVDGSLAEKCVSKSSQNSVLTDFRASSHSPPLAQATEIDEAVPSNTHDDAELIEQRRRRREAIKAKHRPPDQQLPLQTHQLKSEREHRQTSEVGDPVETIVSTAESEKAHSRPHETLNTQCLESSVGAGFLIRSQKFRGTTLGDAISTVQMSPAEDGPSAADYDPKMDMQEDKIKQDAIATSSADDTGVASARDLTTEPVLKEELHLSDFDMFAEDGPSDISATSPRHPSSNPQPPHSNREFQAQAIDMTMLDDSDDSDAYYKVILGELLDERYHVTSNLGKGMFSGVVRATDQQTHRLVAIKIVRNNETMFKAGQKEIGILQKLKSADMEDKKHLIRLERSFEHKGHLCMVFENLSINLREVLKKFGRDVGINLKAVRAYAQQMFLGLGLLRKCNILHADLKPDNVLVNEMRNVLKICDLGSASDASEAEITQYLVSRFYRAPEIILGLPYDFAIDMWSIGCTLFELYTGKILFTGRNNNQMLRAMMECRGKFGHKMLRKAQFAAHHFDDLLNFRSMEKDRLTGKETVRLLNIVKPSRDLKARLLGNAKGLPDAEIKELLSFADLLDRCLNLNPEKRCTPVEALRHPFITRQKQ